MSTEIDIRGINKPAILAALYNASHTAGMGFLAPGTSRALSLADAAVELERQRFDPDYVRGRPIKTDLRGDLLDPRLFDRDNGEGAALRALQPLLANRVLTTLDKRSARINRLADAHARRPDPRKARRIIYIAAKIHNSARNSR